LAVKIVIIGYGGHGYVAIDILQKRGFDIVGYCDVEKKALNPYGLDYLGSEKRFFSQPLTAGNYSAFISIGEIALRQKIFTGLTSLDIQIINAIHPNAIVAEKTLLGRGVFIAARAVINPLTKIGDGVICNTSCSIDHECTVGDFSHICPGTVLCGNVTVGKHSFVGANSVVIPGTTIGDYVIVGAGSTVTTDLLVPGVYVGAPARLLDKDRTH
jgi:sugar O-acyltransferase (sialic acid O-acetyltransferase NeuD family)